MNVTKDQEKLEKEVSRLQSRRDAALAEIAKHECALEALRDQRTEMFCQDKPTEKIDTEIEKTLMLMGKVKNLPVDIDQKITSVKEQLIGTVEHSHKLYIEALKVDFVNAKAKFIKNLSALRDVCTEVMIVQRALQKLKIYETLPNGFNFVQKGVEAGLAPLEVPFPKTVLRVGPYTAKCPKCGGSVLIREGVIFGLCQNRVTVNTQEGTSTGRCGHKVFSYTEMKRKMGPFTQVCPRCKREVQIPKGADSAKCPHVTIAKRGSVTISTKICGADVFHVIPAD